MAAPKKSSTNKGPQRVRMLNGQKVTPTLYDGKHGKYMASKLNDELILNSSGKPLEFKNTGTLEWI